MRSSSLWLRLSYSAYLVLATALVAIAAVPLLLSSRRRPMNTLVMRLRSTLRRVTLLTSATLTRCGDMLPCVLLVLGTALLLMSCVPQSIRAQGISPALTADCPAIPRLRSGQPITPHIIELNRLYRICADRHHRMVDAYDKSTK